MPNATATQVKKSNNPFDIFITGLRKVLTSPLTT